ncbi:MAG: creatininase family protein [Melioribacteraceae bacterium]|nr:creatininase family protein [Melioribacteraceae bacterium]
MKLDYEKKDYLWAEMTWEEVEKYLEKTDTVLLPCGAVEQHGPHLPLDIDYFDADYLAKKVAENCTDPKPLVLPVIPYGVSYHHDDFKGTISVTNNALSLMIYDIGMSLAKNGIKKIIIINGHGDNAPTLNYAAQMINRDAKIFVCVETGETSDVDLYAMTDTPNDVHAGEIETSTTLALRPGLVKMDRAINETMEFKNKFLNFDNERGVNWYVRTSKISDSGVMGDATKATVEKGEAMWDIMIKQLTKFVEFIKVTQVSNLYQKRY